MSVMLEDEQMLDRIKLNPYGKLIGDINRDIPNVVLIAGGSILKPMMYPKEKGQVDIDIYVNVVMSFFVFRRIRRIMDKKWYRVDISLKDLYCRGFIERNSITYMYTLRGYKMYEDSPSEEVQIMVTKNTPLSVVQNFDLTCCQIWYDGVNVYGTHLGSTIQRKAILSPKCTEEYFKGHTPIIDRVIKYTNRGFQIFTPDGKSLSKSDEKSTSLLGMMDSMMGNGTQ